MASKSTKKDAPVPTPAPEETALATQEQAGALAVAEVDEWDFGEDANTGFKNLSRDEFSIPFYGLLQSNSEIVKQNKVQGARGGLYLNSMTNELFEELVVQPLHVERVIVEWYPRGSALGKIAGRHQFQSPEVQDAIARNGGSIISTKERPLKLGENILIDTRYLYFNRLSPDGLTVIGFGVLPFAKTKIKSLVNATSAIAQAGLKAPTWSGRFVLGCKLETKGPDSWHNVVIKAFGKENLIFDRSNLLPPSHPLYKAGKQLQESIVGGVHKADFSAEENFGGDGGSESVDSPGAGGRHF